MCVCMRMSVCVCNFRKVFVTFHTLDWLFLKSVLVVIVTVLTHAFK